MRYEVIEYANGEFGIQIPAVKVPGIFWDRIISHAIPIPYRFETQEAAQKYVDEHTVKRIIR